jgi:hypothetical protein
MYKGHGAVGLMLEARCWRRNVGGIVLEALCWRRGVGGVVLEALLSVEGKVDV